MSLPSQAVFYNEGKEVGSSFVNCGWWWDTDDIGMVKRVLTDDDTEYPDCDWDEMKMYGETYTYEQVIALVMNEL